MQRQFHDDRADGINWERQDEQDRASTHVHPGADASTGWVCGRVCVHKGTGQINKNTQLKATCKSKPWSRHKLPSVTDGSKDKGKHRDQGSKS